MDKGFFQRVYEIARQIPAGKVMSYGQIASLMGSPRSARTVGYAMRAAPEDIPAHRVVHKSGGLCPEEDFGAKQKERLTNEGVGFLADGRVDMKNFMWMKL
ncbi:MAG: methylated-DNA--[protein]-cysteine S-methyltransferase [Oscillospiraceae bacterium]|nr:methylated-DNA--[protein]-cysteine S-methyltransferase [Oscillospiraceae bacterium]